MNSKQFLALFLGLLVMQAAQAKKGQSGGKGRSENAAGIVTVLTDPGLPAGIYSDDPSNDRYYGLGLDDVADPAGGFLDDGDCVIVTTPAADGVDQGRLTFITPFGLTDCPDPALLRQLDIVGSGAIGTEHGPLDGLVDVHFRCPDVFPNESPIGDSTHTSCRLEVREYDAAGEFGRKWIVEWSEVEVWHDDIDVRRLLAHGNAIVFELRAPAKGKGKNEKVSLGPAQIHFEFEITRVGTN